jgi:hypothetical protein
MIFSLKKGATMAVPTVSSADTYVRSGSDSFVISIPSSASSSSDVESASNAAPISEGLQPNVISLNTRAPSPKLHVDSNGAPLRTFVIERTDSPPAPPLVELIDQPPAAAPAASNDAPVVEPSAVAPDAVPAADVIPAAKPPAANSEAAAPVVEPSAAVPVAPSPIRITFNLEAEPVSLTVHSDDGAGAVKESAVELVEVKMNVDNTPPPPGPHESPSSSSVQPDAAPGRPPIFDADIGTQPPPQKQYFCGCIPKSWFK